MKNLQIACGQFKEKGYTGIDFSKENSVADIEHDLNTYPYPFADNSFDTIHITYFVHRVKNLVDFMNEVYRIVKPKGTVTIIAPYFASGRAWQDPYTIRGIAENTLQIFNKDIREKMGFAHYPISANFEIVSINHNVIDEFKGKANETILYSLMHMLNVATDIVITLKKI